MATADKTITQAFIDTVCSRLSDNKRVRRKLASWGRLNIDRRLPFLCVYRRPRGREDWGTAKLIQGEAAYLMAPGDRHAQKSLSLLVHQIAEMMAGSFGAFLILEVWSTDRNAASDLAASGSCRPVFTVFAPRDGANAD